MKKRFCFVVFLLVFFLLQNFVVANINDSFLNNEKYASVSQDLQIHKYIAMFKNRYLDSYARDTLVKIGKPAVPALVKALKNESENVRVWAITSLGMIGDVSVVPALIAMLTDVEHSVRMYACWALGHFEARQAIPALLIASKSGHPRVRFHAKIALMKIRGKDLLPVLKRAIRKRDVTCLDTFPWLLKIKKSRVFPLLSVLLKDTKSGLRRWYVLGALGRVGGKQSAALLLAAYWKASTSVEKKVIVNALGKIRDKRAIPILLKAVQDKHDDVALMASWAIHPFGYRERIAPVLRRLLRKELLQSGSVWSAPWALFVMLGEIKERSVVPDLVLFICDSKRDMWVRCLAVEALGKIGDKRAITALKKAFQEKKQWLRVFILEALAKFKDPRIVPFLEAARKDENKYARIAATEALKKVQGK